MDQQSQNPFGETTAASVPEPRSASGAPSAPTPAPSTSSAAMPAAVAPTPVARRSRSARLLNVALAGAVALAIAGVAFAAGRLTAPPSVTAGNFGNGGGQFLPGGNGQNGQNGRPNGAGGLFNGGLTLEGTVESVTDTTLTLKTASGQTIQIALDGSTTYHAQTDATASDVTTGGKVLVRLNGRGGLGGANGGPTPSGAPTSPTAGDVTVVP